MPPKTKRVSPKRSVDPNVAQVNYQTYMGQVLERVPPVLVESLYDIYNDAVEFCKREPGYSEADRFKIFQRLLKEIAEWDEDEIEEETERVMSRVPWIRSAMQQILVAQVHILLSVRNDQFVSKPKFTFDMPREPEIVFHLLVTAARKVRPKARLFDHHIDEYDAETNLLTVEEVVRKSIQSAVHTLVPLDKIIDAQFGKRESSSRKKKAAEDEEAEAEAEAEADAEAEAERETEDEEISNSELDKLEAAAKKRALEAEKLREERERAEREIAQKTTRGQRLELLEGEEHVDEASEEDIDVMVERLSKMSRDDPMRKELRKNLKHRLAVY